MKEMDGKYPVNIVSAVQSRYSLDCSFYTGGKT
jgi:hypothetical protein